jgi:hypothetical protein
MDFSPNVRGGHVMGLKETFMFILAIGLMSVVGCRSDTAYKESVGPTTSSIQTAEESGANVTPSAAFYLRKAKEEFAEAKALADRGQRDRAASLLKRAEADSELAAALAKEDSEKKAAAEAISSVRKLREENGLPLEEGAKP